MRLDRVITSGTFTLDGGSWAVDNNVWVYGDESECVVIDAAHDAAPIAAAVGARSVKAILCTHAHNDHVNAAWDVAALVDAPVLLHPADRVLWDMTHQRAPDGELADGQQIAVGPATLTVLHTPGHAPGAVCFLGDSFVFSGDTLFQGGPGATGRSYSDYPTIVTSIQRSLLTLPPDTLVHTGHGADTTIGDEAPAFDAGKSQN